MNSTSIAALRGSLRLTQSRLGLLVGVTAGTVSRWERGKQRPRAVSADRLQQIAGGAVPEFVPAPATKQRRSKALRLSAPTHHGPMASGPGWALHHGDLFDVAPTLTPESMDALIGDLPYSSGGLHIGARQQSPSTKYQQNGVRVVREDFDGDQRDQLSFIHWSSEALRRCLPCLKRSAVVALFIDWRQLPALCLAFQSAGLVLRGIAVWDKTEGARPVPGRLRNQCEFIVWGSKGELPMDREVPILPGCIREPIRIDDKHHLTGKPTAVMRWLAQLVIPGGRILDPCAGSGSTGVGALLEGRQFVGIEQSERIARHAAIRLAAASSGRLLKPAAVSSLLGAEAAV